MWSCHRLICSYSYLHSNRIAALLIMRNNSSSSTAMFDEQSMNFEKKSSKTIAYETFIQTPSEFVANNLLQIHDSLELPWWATITLATVAFRFIIGASITIAQQRFIERLQMVRRNVVNELEPQTRILNIQAMQGKTASILEKKKHLQREVKLL